MVVTFLVPSALRPLAGQRSRLDVELADQATLASLLDRVAEDHPALDRRLRDEQGGLRRYVNFYVDGEECRRLDGPNTVLRAGARVEVIPSVAGGSVAEDSAQREEPAS
jgi:molybdopterin converting factor small subunit